MSTKTIVALIHPDPKCKIGCNGNAFINRMHRKEYKVTVCACCAVSFHSDDLEETMSALQDTIIQAHEKAEEKIQLDSSPT